MMADLEEAKKDKLCEEKGFNVYNHHEQLTSQKMSINVVSIRILGWQECYCSVFELFNEFV